MKLLVLFQKLIPVFLIFSAWTAQCHLTENFVPEEHQKLWKNQQTGFAILLRILFRNFVTE